MVSNFSDLIKDFVGKSEQHAALTCLALKHYADILESEPDKVKELENSIPDSNLSEILLDVSSIKI